MNLPKHIEERFDKKFNKPINDEIHTYLNNAYSRYCFYDNTKIKSFIAQILEEEKDRLVGEIERMIDENAHINNYYDTAKEIINIIEDSHEQ